MPKYHASFREGRLGKYPFWATRWPSTPLMYLGVNASKNRRRGLIEQISGLIFGVIAGIGGWFLVVIESLVNGVGANGGVLVMIIFGIIASMFGIMVAVIGPVVTSRLFQRMSIE